MADDLLVAEVDEQVDVVPRRSDAHAGQVAAYMGVRRPAAEAARDGVRHVGLGGIVAKQRSGRVLGQILCLVRKDIAFGGLTTPGLSLVI